jgi:hypothetical protein
VNSLKCEVCEEDIWYCEATQFWYLRVEETTWNNFLDGYDYQDISINFCYKCGKDYRKVKP